MGRFPELENLKDFKVGGGDRRELVLGTCKKDAEKSLRRVNNKIGRAELNRKRDSKVRQIINNCLYAFQYSDPLEIINKGEGSTDYKIICAFILATAETKENLLKMKVKNTRKTLRREIDHHFSKIVYIK